MSESSFGVDTGFDQEETSQSSDVRSGYDDNDEPAPGSLKKPARMTSIRMLPMSLPATKTSRRTTMG